MQAARDRELDGSMVLRKKVMNEPFRYWAPSLTRPGSASASVVQAKVVADVVEALTGAYLVGEGPAAADAFLRWLGLPVLCGPHCRASPGTEPSAAATAAAAVLATPSTSLSGPVPEMDEAADDDASEDEVNEPEAADPLAAESDKGAALSPSPSPSGLNGTETPSILQPASSSAPAEEIQWPLQPKECHCWCVRACVRACACSGCASCPSGQESMSRTRVINAPSFSRLVSRD